MDFEIGKRTEEELTGDMMKDYLPKKMSVKFKNNVEKYFFPPLDKASPRHRTCAVILPTPNLPETDLSEEIDNHEAVFYMNDHVPLFHDKFNNLGSLSSDQIYIVTSKLYITSLINSKNKKRLYKWISGYKNIQMISWYQNQCGHPNACGSVDYIHPLNLTEETSITTPRNVSNMFEHCIGGNQTYLLENFTHIGPNKVKRLVLNPFLEPYLEYCFGSPVGYIPKTIKRDKAFPCQFYSSGFRAITLALKICDSVDVYGHGGFWVDPDSARESYKYSSKDLKKPTIDFFNKTQDELFEYIKLMEHKHWHPFGLERYSIAHLFNIPLSEYLGNYKVNLQGKVFDRCIKKAHKK